MNVWQKNDKKEDIFYYFSKVCMKFYIMITITMIKTIIGINTYIITIVIVNLTFFFKLL